MEENLDFIIDMQKKIYFAYNTISYKIEMRNHMYDFGIIGGDIRQMYITEYLVKAGYSVFCYGVENISSNAAKNIEEVFRKSEIIIAPVPLSKDGKNVFLKNSYKRIDNETFAGMIPPGKTVISGAVNAHIRNMIEEKGGKCIDILTDEKIKYYNSVATAEGTIAEAVMGNGNILYNNKVLVAGYGMCGRILAEKLKSTGSYVTICARRKEIRDEAAKSGFEVTDFDELCNKISEFEYIFNTVPAIVFGENIIKNIKKEALFIDIASMPGGVDKTSVKQNEINYRQSLGLPGKYCPAAMARFYVEKILQLYG